MIQAKELWERLLDGVDALFLAVNQLLLALIKGRLQPDASSYRSGVFLKLGANDVLIQTLKLSVEDAAEARRVIELDPERYLPLDSDVSVFDVTGPVADDALPATEKTFLIGNAYRQVLAEARKAARPALLVNIEGFVTEPPDAPGQALVFYDGEGARLRRTRRALLLAATLILLFAGWRAATGWLALLERSASQADEQILAANRRIRVAQHRLTVARTAVAAIDRDQGPVVREVNFRLEVLARRLPADAEITELNWSPEFIELKGRAYTPSALELELRRAFEQASVTFTQTPGQPAPFQVAISWPDAAPLPPPTPPPPPPPEPEIRR